MTKTYMLELAETIKKIGLPDFVDPIAPSFGMTYKTKYCGKPIMLYTNKTGRPIAIYYKNVMYVLGTTDPSRSRTIRELYDLNQCTTKVFLYPNDKHMAFRDEEGPVKYEKDTNPMYGDYATLIPLPQV